MRRVLPALTLALAAVATPPAARAGLIVAPNANATVEGNSFTAAPLNFPARTFQWILSASEFAVVPPGSQITAIGLRIDASQPAQPPSDMFFSRWDLQLSSALNGIGALSATFADNIGPDAVLVRAGPLTVPAGSLPGGSSPNPFVPIAFATPYTYTGGDLLLTLRHSGRAGTFSVRSDGNTVNATGRAIFGDGADATTAFSLNANYPITQFQIQAVPEPSTLVLTGLGGICSVGVWWRRRAAAPGTSAGGDVERQS